MVKRRGEKVDVAYIKDKKQRLQVLHTGTNELFKEALEYALMCGGSIKLQIGDKYLECGDVGWLKNGDTNVNTSDEISKSVDAERPACSNNLLSPKRVRTQTEPPIQTGEMATQCCLQGISTFSLGNERQCGMCGIAYASETRRLQKLWIGCDNPQCNHRLHASCLLGNSRKITPAFCAMIPYLCHVHRN